MCKMCQVRTYIRQSGSLALPRNIPCSPKGDLEGVDLNPLNTAVLKDFIQLACIEAPEGAFLFRVFGQELLVPTVIFETNAAAML